MLRNSLLVALLGLAVPAYAEAPPAPGLVATPDSTSPAPAPQAPYSLPWQLRPAVLGTVVRSDTSFAFLEDNAGHGGTTIATTLLATWKLHPELAPLVKIAMVDNSPPMGARATTVVNPIVGLTYAPRLSLLGDDLRFATFLAVAIPIGMGGGDTPDAAVAAATKSGISARSAMDNAMFAVNYAAIIPGADLAYVRKGLTLQLEINFLELIRMRGDKVEKDSARINFTTGAHAGYFLLPQLSLSGEVRYQRWLSTPAAVAADTTNTLRDNLTFAVGPRLHFKLADKVWFRPGLSYSRGLDDPMSKQSYNIVQLDLPLAF